MTDIRATLEQAEQSHVLQFWDELSERQRRRMTRQIESLDLSRLGEMREALAHMKDKPERHLSPAPAFELADRDFPYQPALEALAVSPKGDQALSHGEVAVLMVAGGQGTRLGFDGPKGCYELLPLSNMTLFEVFARKIKRVEQAHDRPLPLYVMVGNHNENDTRNFWQDNDYFGLDADNVKFFAQGEMPALDEDGNMLLADKDRIATSPDGHGGVLAALYNKGMMADMRERGVRYLSYLQIDNAMTPVADASFIGLHIEEGAEVSLKVVRKTEPSERVGVYCLDDGVPGIVEYSEFSEAQSAERDESGELKYWGGSIAVHVFSVDYLNRLVESGTDLPLHAAHKKVLHLNSDGVMMEPDGPNAFKFERFIFDTIPMAQKVVCLEVARDEQFLPLKNADGPFGPDGMRQSYTNYWAGAVEQVTGKCPQRIEVDPQHYENARELIAGLDPSTEVGDEMRL
ncbi:MAG: UTP--glucose-1-phosphate uridylyltransferase [Planctomycetota bacterium]|jgi:UDP-N-acetylglucosamine/UDP-N-acetylgalactosamine diphosphorylase